MGKSERDKGKRGEREFLSQLGQLLNCDLSRNLNQSANGGADSLSLPGFAVEIKRAERLSIEAWWSQAVTQAKAVNRKPLLAFRRNRSEWRVVLTLEDFASLLSQQNQRS